ncbi:MAG: glycosyltransferase family 39 protein, partial [Sulfurimonas sp.]|nr:glycosyltransferase family 39 protein [Sulfurimonas sp.]
MLEQLYKNPTKSAYTLIIFLALFSTIYNAFLPLHGDEAYYWMWSHHLQTGYYDHPPMIAYMIYLTNFISESEWGIRLVNVFSMSISALYIYKLSKEMFDEKIALNALLIFSSVILVHAGYILTTTDAPLILFWTLALFYSFRGIFNNSRKDYILAGIFLGLMMLSKYTAILFVFFLIFYALLKKRELFSNINFYIAALIAFIVVSPMVIWNYQHDWISFAFQLTYRGSESGEIYPHLFFEFLGGQFGVFSPVFAGVFFFYMIKERLFYRDEKLFFIALSSAVILLFFFYKSFYTRMELNFGAPAYVGGAILTSYIFTTYKLKKTFKIGLAIALVFTIIGRIAFLTHLEVVQDRMYGNREAVQLLQTHAKDGDSFYGDHLTIAAYLKYYLKNHPDTDIALKTRFSQYDMWREDNFLKDGLVLTTDPKEQRLKKLYNSVKLID